MITITTFGKWITASRPDKQTKAGTVKVNFRTDQTSPQLATQQDNISY